MKLKSALAARRSPFVITRMDASDTEDGADGLTAVELQIIDEIPSSASGKRMTVEKGLELWDYRDPNGR